MKYNHIFARKSLLILATACLALVAGVSTTEAKSRPAAKSGGTAAQSTEQLGRVVIRRIANLGNNVIVSVYLDGSPFGSVEWGQTFESSLPAGRHVLSVEATPRPSYATRTNKTIDVESGDTYTFTAEDNGSGNLVLK
jgi:hypothetical protein